MVTLLHVDVTAAISVRASGRQVRRTVSISVTRIVPIGGFASETGASHRHWGVDGPESVSVIAFPAVLGTEAASSRKALIHPLVGGVGVLTPSPICLLGDGIDVNVIRRRPYVVGTRIRS